MSIEEDLKKGIRCLKEDKFDEALKIFKAILIIEANNAEANYNIAIILYKIGRFDEACAFFSFCLRKEPKNFEYLQGYIKTLMCLGKITEARSIFESLKENYEGDQINSLYLQLNPKSKLDFFYRYLENIGIFESKEGEIVTVNSNPIPLLTNTFLNWFETQSWSDLNLLEFGSGGSTLYFSKFFRSVTSYETNLEWYNQLIKEVPLSVNLYQTDSISSSLQNVNTDNFDVILIDCAENRANLSKILVNKNYKGIIFHDNAEWYRNSINILRSVGYYEIPFFGIKAVDDHVASTSLLIKESNMSKVFNSNWQKLPRFASYRTTKNSWDQSN